MFYSRSVLSEPQRFIIRQAPRLQTLDTEDTETKSEDTEDLEVFAREFSLCDLWLGLCALCDKVWGFGCGCAALGNLWLCNTTS